MGHSSHHYSIPNFPTSDSHHKWNWTKPKVEPKANLPTYSNISLGCGVERGVWNQAIWVWYLSVTLPRDPPPPQKKKKKKKKKEKEKGLTDTCGNGNWNHVFVREFLLQNSTHTRRLRNSLSASLFRWLLGTHWTMPKFHISVSNNYFILKTPFPIF